MVNAMTILFLAVCQEQFSSKTAIFIATHLKKHMTDSLFNLFFTLDLMKISGLWCTRTHNLIYNIKVTKTKIYEKYQTNLS